MPSKTKPTAPSQQAVYKAYFDLHSALREAYWYTPDENAGDRIAAVADACYHVLIQLTQDDIKSRSEDFKKLGRLVKDTNSRLRAVKLEIDHIVHGVAVAAKVLDGIEQALKLAAKFLA